MANALVTRQPARRHDRRATPNPLWNSYPVAGDRWLLLVMIDPDRYWPRLCTAIERPDLLEDQRFADPWKRLAHCRDLIAELETTFAKRTLEEWTPRLDAAGLIWSPVRRVDEAVRDAQARAMGYFPEVEHPGEGRFETVGPPFRIEGVPLGVVTVPGFGPLDFGDADTLVTRPNDPFDRCSLPSLTPVEVPIQIEQLHLMSVSPITVTYDGGPDQLWNVEVRVDGGSWMEADASWSRGLTEPSISWTQTPASASPRWPRVPSPTRWSAQTAAWSSPRDPGIAARSSTPRRARSSGTSGGRSAMAARSVATADSW